jgi:hypothetical protein
VRVNLTESLHQCPYSAFFRWEIPQQITLELTHVTGRWIILEGEPSATSSKVEENVQLPLCEDTLSMKGIRTTEFKD